MKNIKIDKLLLEISETENYQVYTEDDFDDYTEFLDYRKLLSIMLDDIKVISKPLQNVSHILLTKLGDDVVNQGGWIKYLENEKKVKLSEENRQSKSDQILDFDLKLKSFDIKNGKRMLIAGFIITILNFLITILTVQFFQPVENKEKSKVQVERLKTNKVELNKVNN